MLRTILARAARPLHTSCPTHSTQPVWRGRLNDPVPAPHSYPHLADEGTQAPGGNSFAKAADLQEQSQDSNPGSSAPGSAPTRSPPRCWKPVSHHDPPSLLFSILPAVSFPRCLVQPACWPPPPVPDPLPEALWGSFLCPPLLVALQCHLCGSPWTRHGGPTVAAYGFLALSRQERSFPPATISPAPAPGLTRRGCLISTRGYRRSSPGGGLLRSTED